MKTTWAPPAALGGQLLDLYGLDCPPRWGLPRDITRRTMGPQVSRVMTDLGMPPMPWQRYVYDVALEVLPSGAFAYRKAALSVMRQQGKTASAYGLMVWRCMAFPRQNVIYTAQDRGMARQRLEEEMWPMLQASPFRRYWTWRAINGGESLTCRLNGSRIHISSNTESAGHGPPLDFAFMDEVFAHRDDRLQQALSPAMMTREEYGQLWWGSNAGTEKSVFLNDQRLVGRTAVEAYWTSGDAPSVAYFEWGPDESLPEHEPSTWVSCMPGLCPAPPCRCSPDRAWRHTTSVPTVRTEYDGMSANPGAFARAFLNVTRTSIPVVDPNVPRDAWAKSVDQGSRPTGRVVFGLDVTPSREWSTIAAAGWRDDGRMHLEIVDRRRGTDWVVPALKRLARLHTPLAVVLDGRSPAHSLKPGLLSVGFAEPADRRRPRPGDLLVLDTQQAIAACSTWVDRVRADQVRHIDQPSLGAAVGSAVTRPVSDAWMFGRRISGLDICPLMATVFAGYALDTVSATMREAEYDLSASIM